MRPTYVDFSSRPLVPIQGSSRVSDVQVWINDDFVDGLANSRTLRISTRLIIRQRETYETEALGDR